MIEGSFDSRTLSRMNAALDRICDKLPNGEDHAVRKAVAERIIDCATLGKTALGDLVAAGKGAVTAEDAVAEETT
jgi:hypothetical protein